jgi:hypothetical protein
MLDLFFGNLLLLLTVYLYAFSDNDTGLAVMVTVASFSSLNIAFDSL